MASEQLAGKRGRPRLSNKRKPVQVSLPPELYDKLEEEAAEEGIPLGRWVSVQLERGRAANGGLPFLANPRVKRRASRSDA